MVSLFTYGLCVVDFSDVDGEENSVLTKYIPVSFELSNAVAQLGIFAAVVAWATLCHALVSQRQRRVPQHPQR